MKKNILGIALVLIVGLYACTNSDEDQGQTIENFSVPLLLQEVTTTILIPTINEFKTQTQSYDTAITTYLADPSETNLEAARSQWTQMTLAYEATYNFHIGIVRDRFLHQAIYNWPTVASALEDFIANNEVTEQSVAGISPQIKALAGIEYLLFKGDIATTNQEFIDSEKRRNFLKLSSSFMLTQANRLSDIWSADGENYTTTFINSEESGISNSFNLLFNGLYNAVDTGKVTKIGKPGGLENSDVVIPDLVQAPYSNQSLSLLLKSIETVEAVFFSDEFTNISDYIFSITNTNDLNNDIQTAIDDVKVAINAIPVSLEEAVVTNPAEVETLHNKLANLNVLLAVDVRSILSIIITSTDNDGD